MAQQEHSSFQKPLRLWPGVALVIVQWLVRFAMPALFPETLYIGIFGGMIGGALILLWWLFFSRAPWAERLGATALMIAAVFAAPYYLHESIAKGAMGMLFYILVMPVASLALVAWAAATRNLSPAPRRVFMLVAILLAFGVFALIRTGGFTGDFDHDFAFRWTQTPEERLLAQSRDLPAPSPAAKPSPGPAAPETPAAQPPVAEPSKPAADQQQQATGDEPVAPADVPEEAMPAMKPDAEWPGFRGPGRNSILAGVSIRTDWAASPPVELWRRPIGPGWSSFAVRGDFIYTQEQRGEEELVACYNKTTGEPVWIHSDRARFWESNGGAGPRGTPTLHNGRAYALGATGILNALNADDGTVVWSRNAASDTKTETPGWGFSGSPLVFNDLLLVAVSSQLVAYDLATGTPRWFGPKDGTDYSSPHPANVAGIPQILLMNAAGTTGFSPADGKMLWQYPMPRSTRIIQPAQISGGDFLVSQGDTRGMRRIAVSKGPGGWKVQERWTTIGLKPYFSDFVIHNGYAYGVDGAYLSCIDINDGKRKWKGGRYGQGQLILLPDQDLLLVLSEKGELALVKASPDAFTELARRPALEGKTWNHPVLTNDILLVRNAEEMAAFRLQLTTPVTKLEPLNRR